MLLYQIAITLIPHIGDINGKRLIAQCGSVDAIFKEKKSSLLKINGIGKTIADAICDKKYLNRAEEEIKFIEKYKITPLYYFDDCYPEHLKDCIDAPIMLYFKGNIDFNNRKILSIVGTRKATGYGKMFCNQLVKDMAELDVLVVSGLAYGIDICAHKSAMEYNLPTVAVLAHGLDIIYPSVHRNIAEKMLSHGGLLTDYISKTTPEKENFPSRNRIIAGIADATVIIEARKPGGALITAEIANSYNRDVFAVPGKTNDISSVGCNYLIKSNKAALIESAKDVKYIMGWNEDKKTQKKKEALLKNLPPEEASIVAILKEHGKTGIDWLCEQSGHNVSKLAALLLNLEFEGIVRSLPGKMYSLA